MKVPLFFLIFILFSPPLLLNAQKPVLVNFEKTECEPAGWGRIIMKRIISQKFYEDTLELEIAAVVNCAGISEVDFKYNQDTLAIDYFDGKREIDTATGSMVTELTSCDCYFVFSFKIVGLKVIPSVVKFAGDEIHFSKEKYKTFPIKYEIYKGDTINYRDKYGMPQGRFIMKDSSQVLFKDGKSIGLYYSTGILKEEYRIENGRRSRYITYYENGKLKSDCEIAPDEDWLDENFKKCTYWDIHGNKTP